MTSLGDVFHALRAKLQPQVWPFSGVIAQARKRHININFFVWLVLGRPRVCPGDFTGFVPGTKPCENLGQTRVFSLVYTVEARFHRVCPWDKPGLSLGQSWGRRAAHKVYVKKVYALANCSSGLFNRCQLSCDLRPTQNALILVAQIAWCNRDVRCESNRTPPTLRIFWGYLLEITSWGKNNLKI